MVMAINKSYKIFDNICDVDISEQDIGVNLVVAYLKVQSGILES